MAQERRNRPLTRALEIPDGGTVLCRVGRGHSDLRTLLQVWWNESYAFEGVQEPRWVIDAGANVGYATRWLAMRYPGATVIALEPDSANTELLRANTAGLRNVVILQAALCAYDGRMQLLDPGDGPWSYRVQSPSRPWSAGDVRGEVAGVSLAAVVERYGIDRIGLLKVDVEGGELDLFADCGRWITRVDAIAVELHDRIRPGCMQAFTAATRDFGPGVLRGDCVFVARSG